MQASVAAMAIASFEVLALKKRKSANLSKTAVEAAYLCNSRSEAQQTVNAAHGDTMLPFQVSPAAGARPANRSR